MDYEKLLAEHVKKMKPSGIRKFFDLLDDMKDVVALTVGQPDFVTPWHIRQAAIDSLENGKTYYTSNSGLLSLREELSAYLNRHFGLPYTTKELGITVGGSEAIDLAFRTFIEPGDEVLIPMPCFVCYEPIVSMLHGIAVPIVTEEKDQFKLKPQALLNAITTKTKILVLPYPNNPTGAIMTQEDLESIAEILRGTNILILSDEIYAELTYGRTHTSIASLDGMWERTILVSGFSKAYAMTGWRLGYYAAPEPIAKQMLKIHQYAIMCAPTASQFAAIEALKEGDSDIQMMREEYDRRRKLIVNGLRKLGLPCFEPEGAFYVYPNISGFGMNSNTFCERLLTEERVAIVPGTAFGDCGEGFARISYAYSVKHIEQALERMGRFIAKLKSEQTNS